MVEGSLVSPDGRNPLIRTVWIVEKADEIHRQHPHLSLGQIHAALAYYFDHRDELDAKIAEQLRFVTESRERSSKSLVRAKLASKS